MKYFLRKFIFLFGFIAGVINFSFATITIDSVTTTTSSCTNNGSATIFATSNPTSALFYALVAGPVLSPLQNNNTFSSLFPGNYTARVYDVNFDSTETQFQIAGNYLLPTFGLAAINPTCAGFTDGSITANADTNFGFLPFLYEMISPVVIPQQTSNVFTNLDANTYLIRMTDACGNYQTRTAVLTNTGTGIGLYPYSLFPYLTKIGCDTMVATYYCYIYKEKANLPIILTTNTTSGGTVIKTVYPEVIDTINYVPGYYKISDTIPNATYGDYLQVTLTDTCGHSISSIVNQIAPFDFEIFYFPVLVNCAATFTASLTLKYYPQYPYDITTPMAPTSFILEDTVTNTIVDSGSCGQNCSLTLKAQIPGNWYKLTVTDGCGQVWQQVIQWPVAGSPNVSAYNSVGCVDSTATLTFGCFSFQSAVQLTILSGPATAQSSKPQFAYNQTISYPKIYSGFNSTYIYITGFSVGNYTYEVSDSCGNTVPGSFYVEPYMVSDLNYAYYVKPSCLNNNTLFFDFQQGTPMAIYAAFTDVATNTVVATRYPPIYGVDSLVTLNTGTYAFEIYYGNYNGNGNYYNGYLFDSLNTCWSVFDTLTIIPYLNSSFVTNTTIYCNGTNYVQLVVDTLKGVPPYKFAIISGPQTFSQQDSGIFQINLFGNYLVSIEDACGNSFTQQITVSSDSFPPIIKNGLLCAGNDVVLSGVSSPYFIYIWQYPNGTTFIGDSITFHPFSIADTGLYQITKIININGCNDTLFTSYYLAAGDSFPQIFSICEGDSVLVGNSVYKLPGIYYNTLATTSGCDSLIITTLAFIPLLIDSDYVVICAGDSVTTGNSVYFLPGTYMDTVIISGGCKKLIVTILSFNSYLIYQSITLCQGDSIIVGNHIYFTTGVYSDSLTTYLGCDSIINTDLTIISKWIIANTVTICNGDSLLVGNNVYFVTGAYTDTLTTTAGCDSIINTLLNVNPLILNPISVAICNGDSILAGNQVYYLPGVYNDTLVAISGCDSIIITTLSFLPLIISYNTVVICNGDSIIVGSHVYYLAGTYTDTITAVSGCKEIIITQLIISNITSSINAVICQGDSFAVGNNFYQLPGLYTDTLISSAGCDSVVTLNLANTISGYSITNAIICAGDSFVFGGSYYFIQGFFTDTIATTGCDSVSALQLNIEPLPLMLLNASNDTVQAGDTIQLSCLNTQMVSYLWYGNSVFINQNASQTIATINQSTWIYLQVTNSNGCSNIDSVFIYVKPADGDSCDQASLFVPNVFTPNNDGYNDVFKVVPIEIVVNSIKIFNRWGVLLFETNHINNSWDGTWQNNKCTTGVYFYVMEYESCIDGSLKIRNGAITLL